MKLAPSALVLAALAPFVAANADHATPYDLKLYDSHIPQALVDALLGPGNGRNASEKSYERLYISSPEGLGRPASDASYLCEMHPKEPPRPHSSSEAREEIAAETPAAILGNAMALIHAALPSGVCLWAYDLRGTYWTYALCSGDKIIQYHEGAPPHERGSRHVPSHPSTVFVLGRFSDASTAEVRFHNQAAAAEFRAYEKTAGRAAVLVDEKAAPYSHQRVQKAVSQTVTGGSVCDMTLQPRTAEVVYRCAENGGPDAAILDVFEIKTCHYKMLVHVPGLCEYAPFSPHKNTLDAALDVPCQRVRDPREAQVQRYATFDEYRHNIELREHTPFPVRADNRLDIADHFLAPVGRGFYFARSRRELGTPSSYFNERNVVLFSGWCSSSTDLNAQFAKVIFRAVGSSLLAPSPPESDAKTLEWSHSFVLWYEIYDYKGDLLAVTRLEHDASEDTATLKAQLLDPVTLLDVEGDMPRMSSFERPDFEAPYDAWNFELFSEKKAPLKRKRGGKKKKPVEGAAGTGSVRQIMAYNRGMSENARVIMELVDQTKGKVLQGGYIESGDYVFEIENEEGFREQMSVSPMNPDQDFMGFTVRVSSGAPIDPKDESSAAKHDGPAPEDKQRVMEEEAVAKRPKTGTMKFDFDESTANEVGREAGQGTPQKENPGQEFTEAEQIAVTEREIDEL